MDGGRLWERSSDWIQCGSDVLVGRGIPIGIGYPERRGGCVVVLKEEFEFV
jgi:hypothetical protein